MVPFSKGKVLRQVEFLSLNDNRVLVILVTNDSEVEKEISKLHSKIDHREHQIKKLEEICNVK